MGLFVPLVKTAHAVADYAVRRGHVLAGSEKIEPGFHHEGLDKTLGSSGVLKDPPAHRTIAQANRAGGVNGVREGILVGRPDARW